MALLPRHVVALCGQAGRGEGGKVHSLFWWKKCVETLIVHLEEWSPIKFQPYRTEFLRSVRYKTNLPDYNTHNCWDDRFDLVPMLHRPIEPHIFGRIMTPTIQGGMIRTRQRCAQCKIQRQR